MVVVDVRMHYPIAIIFISIVIQWIMILNCLWVDVIMKSADVRDQWKLLYNLRKKTMDYCEYALNWIKARAELSIYPLCWGIHWKWIYVFRTNNKLGPRWIINNIIINISSIIIFVLIGMHLSSINHKPFTVDRHTENTDTSHIAVGQHMLDIRSLIWSCLWVVIWSCFRVVI